MFFFILLVQLSKENQVKLLKIGSLLGLLTIKVHYDIQPFTDLCFVSSLKSQGNVFDCNQNIYKKPCFENISPVSSETGVVCILIHFFLRLWMKFTEG